MVRTQRILHHLNDGATEMKPTMSKVNEAIAYYGVELVKGDGYFYFADIGEGYVADLIPSVYSNRLSTMSLEKWVEYVATSLREARETDR